MRHVRSSESGIFLLETQGNPNLKTNPLRTDFDEIVKTGSLCVDKIENVLYILEVDTWKPVGNEFQALVIEENGSSSVYMPDYSTYTTFGAILNSPNSIINQNVTNTVVIGGKNIVATESDTVYVPNITFYDGSNGLLNTLKLSDNRIWNLPDKSGTIALIEDVQDIIDLIDNGAFGSNCIVSIPVIKDKNFITIETNGDGSLASNTAISYTPLNNSYVSVFINGQEFEVGDANKSKPFYFSNDGGVTAKSFNQNNLNGKIMKDDLLYYNSSITGFELEDGWRLSLHYQILSSTDGGSGTGGPIINPTGLHELVDVNLLPPLTDNQVLQYSTLEGKWVNQRKDDTLYYQQSNINSDRLLNFVLLSKYKIQDIVIYETSNNNAGNISIGTVAGGNNIIDNVIINAGTLNDTILVNRAFSISSDTPLYISSTNWGGGVVRIYFTIRKIIN